MNNKNHEKRKEIIANFAAKKIITISKLAELANVSRKQLYRFLNDEAKLTDAQWDQVERVIKYLEGVKK